MFKTRQVGLSANHMSPVVLEISSSFLRPFNFLDAYKGNDRTLGWRQRVASENIKRLKIHEEDPIVADTEVVAGENLALILWPSPKDQNMKPVILDPEISQKLRAHQREGVQFIFDCLMQVNKKFPGCILADEMGLGKTLQSIAVLFTLIFQNIGNIKSPAVRRALILCPASLVKNWASEIDKWVSGGKLKYVAVAETLKEKVEGSFLGFKYSREAKVLICSYETFRNHGHLVSDCPIDLIICDEAHRLKNENSKTSQVIASMHAKKRLLITGTPIQNDLDEFFAMILLAVPLLKEENEFHVYFVNAIMKSKKEDSTREEKTLGKERLQELTEMTSKFILRRANNLMSKLLPPKNILIVFCKMSEYQRNCYEEACARASEKMSGKKQKNAAAMLSALQELQKLSSYCQKGNFENFSGKFSILASLIDSVRIAREKIVIISNFTKTLDLVENFCMQRNWKFFRLDGSDSIKKRHENVNRFNDPSNSSHFIFLLSSKAGGCGINLIGSNRLVSLDADWNPATDKQALARIWREGQKKECFIYRLFTTGSIDERILQRQIFKNNLSNETLGLNEDDGNLINFKATDDFARLINYVDFPCSCETFELMKDKKIPENSDSSEEKEDDLMTWRHFGIDQISDWPRNSYLSDDRIKANISFLMSCKVSSTENLNV